MLSASLLSLSLVTAAALVCLHCRQRLGHYRTMERGLDYIAHLIKVLELLPQHRGMANTYLNGDQSFLEKMSGAQHSLEQQMAAIDRLHGGAGLDPQLAGRWRGIREGWTKLIQGFQSLNAAESFERHSALINELLYLISDAADRMHLSRHPEAELREVIRTGFNLLPPMIENIGQARGIGSGAAARGELLATVRIKLEFLHERLGSSATGAYATLERCLTHSGGGDLATIRNQTEGFLETISSHLLGDRISIAANDYFSEGSAAFNGNLALLGEITTTLTQQVNAMIPRLKSHLLWSITLAIGVTMLLLSF